MYQLVCMECQKDPPGTLMTQKIDCGWTLFGNIVNPVPHAIILLSLHCDAHLDRSLARMLELEKSPQKHYVPREENFCEDSKVTTIKVYDVMNLSGNLLKWDIWKHKEIQRYHQVKGSL